MDATIIAGSLDDKELRKSIDDLVKYVDNQTHNMASNFVVAMNTMKGAMKDFAVSQKVSVDLMQEAWKKMSVSFDAMLKAQQNATSSGNNSGSGGGNSQYADNTVGHLQEIIALEEKRRKEMTLGSDALRDQNKLIEERNAKLKSETTSEQVKAAQAAKKELQNAFTMPARGLADAEKKLQQLQSLSAKFQGKGILDQTQWNRLNAQIQTTQEKIDRLRQKKPTSIKDVLGMDESSVDAIAKKMSALKKVTVDPQNTAQVKQLGDEYQRLKRLQAELMGQNIQMTHSNNYLAQSFGYIRNRLVYAMTLGAITSFAKQVYEIRGQYELLERSLGVLVGSFERGSQIFQELNQMAIESPFTLMELAGAAKQLTAYNFAANEVVDTTRRLADISAALGVPMERLTYNLGQIRAQTVLTARDARDFANAGLPIVASLAEHFTELEGKIVTTGDVYDRMSKKMVSYSDVMVVLNSLTDEGGKFFNFQAKQAETLKVKLANLTLAWNNMLNEIGSSNQGLLTMPINALKTVFENWQSVSRILSELIVLLGVAKAAQFFFNQAISKGTLETIKNTAATQSATAADFKAVISKETLTKAQAKYILQQNLGNRAIRKAVFDTGLLTVQEYKAATAANVLGKSMTKLQVIGQGVSRFFGNIFSRFIFTPQMAIFAVVGALVDWYFYSKQISEKTQQLNESIRNNAKENFDSVSKFLKQYQNVYEKITSKDKQGDFLTLSDSDAKKTWETIRDKIMESSAAGKGFVMQLEQIDDINERIRRGFDYATAIRDANAALLELKDTGIQVAQTGWWDWAFDQKGLTDEIRRVNEALSSELADVLAEDIAKSKENINRFIANIATDFEFFAKENLIDLNTNNVDDYRNSVIKVREAFEQVVNQIAESEKLTKSERQEIRRLIEADLNDSFLKGKFPEIWKEYFGEGRAATEEFLDWLQNTNQSATTKMYKDMTQSQIDSINVSDKKWKNWIDEMLERFSEGHKDAYDDLKRYVDKANLLRIFIPTFFGLAKEESWLKQMLGEKGLDEKKYTTQGVGSLDAFIEQEKKRANSAKKELKRLASAGITLDNARTEEEKKHIEDVTKEYNDASAAVKAFNASLVEKEVRKSGNRKPEDVVAEALKQEIQLIKEMQSNYDKLRKAGVSNMDAIDLASKGYEATIIRINQVLSKFGIDKFNAANFAGKDVRSLLKSLEEQRNALLKSGKVKTSSLQALDVEIQKLTVDTKTYDMKKVTDGLNSELGKIKDEYELAIELDANPELGGIFAEMFNINTSELPHSIDEYMNRVYGEFNKLRELYGGVWSFDIFKADEKTWKEWGDVIGVTGEELEKLKKPYVEAQNVVKKWVQNTIKQTQDLQYELADNNGKIAIAEEKLANLRKLLEKETNEEQRRFLKLQIQDQQNAIAKLKEEVLQLLPTYMNLFNSITEHSTSVTRRIAKQWKDALNSAVLNADGTYTITDPLSGEKATITAKQYGTQIDKVNGKLRETQTSWQKIKEAFTKGEDGIVDWQQGLTLVGNEISNIANGLQELSSILEDVGIKFSDDINYAIEGLSQVGSGVSEFAQGFASGNYIQATVGGIKAVVGLGKTAAGIFGGARKDYFTELNNSLQGLLDTLNKVADYQLESLGKMTGSKAASEYRKLIENNEMAIKSYRDLAEARGRSGSSWGSHSYAYRTNRELKNDWNEISKFAGQTVTSIQDMYNLSPENLKEIMTNMPVQWSKIDEEIRKALESIIEYGDKANEYTEALGVAMTNMSLDDLTNDFESMLQDMDSDTEEFSENFEKYMRNAIIRSMMVGTYASELENWYNNFKKRITDDQLSDSDISALREEYMDIVNRAITERDKLLSVVGTSTSSGNLSALQQGIQSISEDTASALEAYMNGVSQQVYLQSDILTQIRDAVVGFDMDVQLGVFSQMLLQLQQSYVVQQNIERILQNVINPSGRAFMVELAS